MASMGSALLASALLVFLVSLGRTHADDDPHPSGPSVRTAAGRILGRWVEAERGGARFGAFLGIPYAEPPVGQLRYKTTQPIKRSIDDTIQATEDAPVCPQLNTRNGETEVIGQEDCLYLNVYAVMAKPSPLLPVIFLVHGGRFDHGSGRMDAIGPHFLLTGGDVLVVTVNFRQGPLGFLSLDTDDVPGNAGLKDLVVALEWVKQNIVFFGGDASRITAMGVSTGASAVHLLSLIPQARGLFARAFLMGGHAISPRAYTERHVERAVALAHILGSDNNGTDAVTRTLRGASAEKILMACNDPRAIDLGYPTGLFLPSPERRAAGTAKLLEHDPESMLRQPRVAPMPIVFGMNEREGSYARNSWDLESKSPAELDEMLPRLVPTDILPGADTRAQLGLQPGAGPGGPLNPRLSLRLAQQVRSEYGADMTNNTDIFVEFLGDSFIGASALRVADFMARFSTPAAPFFLYKFLVDDDYNYVKKLRNISLPGSTHTDDLGYVARSDKSPDLNQDASAAGVAPEILRRWSRAVVDFAKGLEPVRGWTPVHPGPLGRSAPALHIGPKVRFEMNRDMPRRLRFWDSVYSCLRRPQSRPTTARGL